MLHVGKFVLLTLCLKVSLLVTSVHVKNEGGDVVTSATVYNWDELWKLHKTE